MIIILAEILLLIEKTNGTLNCKGLNFLVIGQMSFIPGRIIDIKPGDFGFRNGSLTAAIVCHSVSDSLSRAKTFSGLLIDWKNGKFENVDNVASTGKCQVRENVVNNAAEVATNEQFTQTSSVNRVTQAAGVALAVVIILETRSERR